MLSLSCAAIVEKNKLSSDGSWLVALVITLPDSSILRFVRNNENVTIDGDVYLAIHFEIDDFGEQRSGEIPSYSVRVGNATRAIQYHVERHGGGVGSDVELSVAHSEYLTKEVSVNFQCTGCKADRNWVTFVLGASAPWRKRFPGSRIMKQVCRYKTFKGSKCKYAGAETTCNRSLARCYQLGNQANFGGFPGVADGTITVK